MLGGGGSCASLSKKASFPLENWGGAWGIGKRGENHTQKSVGGFGNDLGGPQKSEQPGDRARRMSLKPCARVGRGRGLPAPHPPKFG